MELCKKPAAEEERKLKRLLVSNYQKKGGTLENMKDKDKAMLRQAKQSWEPDYLGEWAYTTPPLEATEQFEEEGKKALERLMLYDGKIHVTGFTLTKEGLEIEGYFIGDQGGETS